jgi:hypothetical protein
MASEQVPVIGHCEFSVEEVIEAFQDLANWATTGTAPEP